ncbi:PhzF family phenazine biosynthesis protein [Adonisia turfae]|uniref:PhzF family phenazine biosynthesis protein n=1 Tax=Adonisia turfae CCMR0081 TaxID=2292702 RepID=A0A6M0RTI6_9CYAN|nr:PhzF family phenazine biosynthesis protein [Adonisia turfae]NEZ59011.1 PhzF family phenazine biosynthesis protein [Adonisia turfae CCMR0081]
MRYRFYTVDVFTKHIFGGNPLAVFPEADGLKPEQMQRIASEFNLSETAFVLPPETTEGTYRLRIFTPGTELPFAGHPTIGTAYVLAAIGKVPLSEDRTTIIFEEGVGDIPVVIHSTNDQPTFAQFSAAQLPEFGPEPPPLAKLASMLSLQPSDLHADNWTPQALSCGVPFLFIPICDRTTLAKAQLNLTTWEATLASYWAPHIYLFTPDPELEGSDFRARMFAPAMGIQEDPATGAAATAFAGYLGQTAKAGKLRWVIEQGFDMGRPSFLDIEADKDGNKISAIRVGGNSVQVSQGEITIPSGDNP